MQEALERDKARRQQEADISELRERFKSLTPRERDVLPLVTSGLPSKEIAAMIGTSVTTVKVHRSKLTRKIGARSVAELVKWATKLDIARQYQRQL